MAFDRNGMLIIPQGAVEEFREKRKQSNNRRHRTGVFVKCRCGWEWERGSRKSGTIRCHRCGTRITTVQIPEGEVR